MFHLVDRQRLGQVEDAPVANAAYDATVAKNHGPDRLRNPALVSVIISEGIMKASALRTGIAFAVVLGGRHTPSLR